MVSRDANAAARRECRRATAAVAGGRRRARLCYDPGMPFDINGIRIPTIQKDNVAVRCRGCGGVIEGTPFRVNVMDITAVEIPPAWSGRTTINPGPYQLHADPACARLWMRERGNLFCRKSSIRELMRPIVVPGETPRWGLCDGFHHDEHELVPA
jgi:hypothetical protein